jgi:hypothetical protein
MARIDLGVCDYTSTRIGPLCAVDEIVCPMLAPGLPCVTRAETFPCAPQFGSSRAPFCVMLFGLVWLKHQRASGSTYLSRQVDLDRLQEIDHIRGPNEIKQDWADRGGRDVECRSHRALYDRIAVVGCVIRQSLLAPFVDIESVAMCDPVAQMVDQFKYRRPVKVIVGCEFVAERQ